MEGRHVQQTITQNLAEFLMFSNNNVYNTLIISDTIFLMQADMRHAVKTGLWSWRLGLSRLNKLLSLHKQIA